MSQDFKELKVNNNKEKSQFEIQAGSETAFSRYKLDGKNITFLHTVVPPDLEGHGLGSKLVQEALEIASRENLSVVPLCPFVADYINRHPQYQNLVKPEYRA